jgi:beta-phosphoglucomutase
LAVCSGALRGEITPTLDRLGLRQAFAALVSAEDVAHSKPDPESYARAVTELGRATGRELVPAACAAIEDTPAGIASARGAGLPVLAVAHTHPVEALTEAQVIRRRLAEIDAADWQQVVATEAAK